MSEVPTFVYTLGHLGIFKNVEYPENPFPLVYQLNHNPWGWGEGDTCLSFPGDFNVQTNLAVTDLMWSSSLMVKGDYLLGRGEKLGRFQVQGLGMQRRTPYKTIQRDYLIFDSRARI